MHIEDPEAFKTWLTSRLEPLCDADPAALAKYVYALVKKDKPINDLKASMIDQLEVFLQKETHGFVDLLFRTLGTQLYEVPNAAPEVPAPTPQVVVAPVNSIPPATSPKLVPQDAEMKDPPAPVVEEAERKPPSKEEKDERSRRGRRRGSSPSPERRRSRSRSYDRRRSRSRERDRARAWRNKSPPSRRYERRRSYSKSPRRHSRSRTPSKRTFPAGGRYRNRSPPHSRSRSRSRSSHSRSPVNRDRKDAGSPRDAAHGDTDLRLPVNNIQSVVAVPPEVSATFPARRCRDFDEKGYCMRGDHCPYDHGSDPVIVDGMPNIMYNGSTQVPPPIPLGPPGHVADGIHHPPPLQRLSIPPPPISTNLTEYNPDAPSMEPRLWGRPMYNRGGIRGMGRGVLGRGGFIPPHQRELINVVTGPSFRNNRHPGNPEDGRMMDGKRGGFDFNRLGQGRMNHSRMPNQPSGNTSLQVKKIPPGVNNITHLNNHFSKFGKILNIQVGFEGDPESALITFSTHTEANIAYKSTEAVLNNRFIRVHWYSPNNNNNNTATSNGNTNENKPENAAPPARPSVLERLGAAPAKVLNPIQPTAVQEEKVLPNIRVTVVNNSLSKTVYIPSAMKKENAERKQLPPEVLAKREEEENLLKEKKKKMEEARKEGLKKSSDIRKRKQELLEKQLNHQKLLIQRLETGGCTTEAKTLIMSTIKGLQESIEKLRKDLTSSVKASLTKTTKPVPILTKEHLDLVKKTKEETQRELLDAELDLHNRQQEGKDVMDLKKKVVELKMKAHSLGLSSMATRPAPYPRGRGAPVRARGRARGGRFAFAAVSYEHNVVDHRPTKLLISGYEQDDKADVLSHFAQFGEVADYISDDATPSLVLNYKSRKEAEVAVNKGRNFQDRLLSVTWATPSHSIRSGITTKNNHRSVTVLDENLEDSILEEGDDEEIVGTLSPDTLLQDEEEEEEEDRSWRR